MTGELLISDLSICQPASALSRQWQDGKWMLMDYETVDDIAGQMLCYTYYPVFHSAMRRPKEQEFVNAPIITLPLAATGWHEICLGMHYASAARLEGPQIRVKLSGEEMYSTIGREQCQPKDGDFPEKSGFGIFDVAEVCWRTADLTDQDLIIAPPGLYYGNDQFFTNLLYVRLRPVLEGQISRYPTQQQSQDTRRLIAYYGGPPKTVEAARDWVDCFRDSDFGLILWGAAHTRTPEVSKAAIQHARELGIDVYGSIRFQGLKMDNYLPIHEIYAENSLNSSIVTDHPEWRKRDPQGVMTNSLSLAFPEVRDFWLGSIRDFVEQGFDGINIVFARSFPFVLYEQPAVESFQQRYDDDPRLLEPTDDRWVRHRAAYVTDFLRDVRAMLDEQESRTGIRLGTAYHVMNSVSNSLYFTMDVETWIREGLIDHCIVHPTHSAEPHMPDPAEFTPEFLGQYVKLAKGTACRVYADVYPRRMPAEAYRHKAMAYYDAGVDGLSMWDTQARRSRCSEWSIIRMLGHRDDLPSWGKNTEGVFRKTSLRTLQGITTNRAYSFTDG